jgi:hypothetical protein
MQLPIPRLARIHPLSKSAWNVAKPGSDTLTFLMKQVHDKNVAFVPNENHSDGGYCWKRTCSSVFHDKSLDQYFIKGGDSSKFLSSSMSGNSSARSALREIDLKVKNPSDRRQTM